MNSMSDKVCDGYRHRVFDVIEQTPQHEYQSLTKYTANMLAFSRKRTFPRNFWAGTTIKDMRVIHRLDTLKQVDAEIRFISAEPLLGRLPNLDLDGIHWLITGGESGRHLWDEKYQQERALAYYDRTLKTWLPRPDRMDWVREIAATCAT